VKKIAATFSFVSLLVSMLIGTLSVGLASANFHVPPTPLIEILSPTSPVNVSDVEVVVRAKVPSIGSGAGAEGIKWLNCSLDGKAPVQLTLTFQGEIHTSFNDTTNPFSGDPYKLYIATTTLKGLPDGLHHLSVRGESFFDKSLSATSAFAVDTVLPEIKILSPTHNQTYFSTEVAMQFYAGEPVFWAGYSLDEKPTVTSKINTTLTNLSLGSHVLKVYANDTAGNICQPQIVVFTVADVELPIIAILLSGTEYNSTNFQLDFTISEDASWIGYSLDDQTNVTIRGNTTLTGLSSGSHSLRIYASDTLGNAGSIETVYFTVTEPFPAIPVFAISVTTITLFSMTLTVYFKKRKRGAPTL
jgi:hypothetical protein